jgi:NADH-quinone oxidoreductase subunit E
VPVLSDELQQEAQRVIARYPEGRGRSAILPLLYLFQSVEGHVTREALREVAELLGTTTAEVEAVATFYTMIRLRPTGKHLVNVCTNLPCALRGAREVYEVAHQETAIPHGGEMSDDELFSVHEEECLGACDAAQVVQIDFANHDRVTPERMRELVFELRNGRVPQPARGTAPADFRGASRILAGVGLPAGELAADAEKAVPPAAEVGTEQGHQEPQPGPTRQEARGAEAGAAEGERESSERPS